MNPGEWFPPLTQHEYWLAQVITARRQEVNAQAGIRERKMGADRDAFKIGVDGLVAEFAICKHANVWPELDCTPRHGGHDCIIGGIRIDVKAVPVEREFCFLPARKRENTIDWYVWCMVVDERAKLLGWIAPAEVYRDEFLEQSPRWDEQHFRFPSSLLGASPWRR